MLRNRWTACSGISGRHAPESVDGMLRILHVRKQLYKLGRISNQTESTKDSLDLIIDLVVHRLMEDGFTNQDNSD
jgi:hypothetical protein